mmetsp:Transcript_22730/g.45472  ORF Transcript_22730/g.45472 Transcript_22730/m.45472 type:complete len:96 (-) Transcript_22730:503-790(-)
MKLGERACESSCQDIFMYTLVAVTRKCSDRDGTTRRQSLHAAREGAEIVPRVRQAAESDGGGPGNGDLRRVVCRAFEDPQYEIMWCHGATRRPSS